MFLDSNPAGAASVGAPQTSYSLCLLFCPSKSMHFVYLHNHSLAQQSGGRGWGYPNAWCGNDGWDMMLPVERLGTAFGVVFYPTG
jgi:hypothetical protein